MYVLWCQVDVSYQGSYIRYQYGYDTVLASQLTTHDSLLRTTQETPTNTAPMIDERIEARGCSAYGSPPPEYNGVSATADADTDGGAASKTLIQAEIQSFLDRSQQRPLERLINDEVRSFSTILLFLTRLPMPHTVDLHPGYLMQGMSYLPVVGTLIGGLAACVYDAVIAILVDSQNPQQASGLAALASLATTCIITGCFHHDGLADTADGFGGGWTRERILTIMTDSRVGTYGCTALILYSFSYANLLQEHAVGRAIAISKNIVVAHTLSRVTAPYLIHFYDYVDDANGPKSSFYAYMVKAKHIVSVQRVLFAFGWGGAVASLVGGYGFGVTLALLAAVLWFARCAGRYTERVLGGVMGDFLGATICMCELCVLFWLRIIDCYHGALVVWWERLQQDVETRGAMTAAGILEYASTRIWSDFEKDMLQEPRFVAVLRCVALVVGLQLWSVAVQFVNYRLESSKAEQNEDPMTAKNVPYNHDDGSPKCRLSRTLKDPSSTFTSRYEAVQAYVDILAKPVGSLGTLEAWACRLAALQQTPEVSVSNVACLIFAGDHGAAAAPSDGGEGCSAYPQAVTRAVLMGLHKGVAGATVLARANNVQLRVVDVGVILMEGDEDIILVGDGNVRSDADKLPRGTHNYCTEAAMSGEECKRCMEMGRRNLIEFMDETRSTVIILGEVGIGNTTSSSALIAALTNANTETVVGGGAFSTKELSKSAVAKKVAIVKKALKLHYGKHPSKVDISAIDALAKLGGSEVAALVGAMLEASERNIPVLVDGFIASAAALVAVCISASVGRVLFFSSSSVEPGQGAALEKIREILVSSNLPVDSLSRPVLDMGLRMGEATAGLLAIPILRSSAAIIRNMATLQEVLQET